MKRTCLISFLFVTLAGVFSACGNSDGDATSTGKPYDPNQPVKVTTFYPQEGGMATKVIIKGENFGTDPEKLKVYFNEKQASVVRTTGDMIYVITPRQPGDKCKLSVEVDGKSVDATETFEYHTQVTVSTLVGRPKSDNDGTDGTLAQAGFGLTTFICVDKEQNVFVIERTQYRFRQINEKMNFVTTLASGSGQIQAPFIPTVEEEGQKIFVALWVAGGNLMQFDPQTQWTRKKVKPVTAVALDEYISAAANVRDKLVYIKAKNGNLVKMNPVNKEAELVASGLDAGMTYQAVTCFDSLNPDLLYICYSDKHCIYVYNLATGEYSLFAGMKAQQGYADGKRLEAQFNAPWQICFDLEGIMYIADSGNHCIRSIDREGIVRTVIGIPGRSGYVDGNPDDALFNAPQGVAVDSEGTIYIADTQNKCVRKLAIQ